MPVLLVVAGPTAVGKTSVSIKLAKLIASEVVSADARQIFKETNIGTAKPTVEETEGVPYHFISSHSIFALYSVGDYEQESLQILDQLFKRHETVLMAGGSGLYVRAVCDGLDEMPESDPEIRQQLLHQLENRGLPALVNQLQQLDPEYAAAVDNNNPQRVLRGLEVCLSTGEKFSSFRTGKKAERPFETIKIGLYRDREELYRRIDLRVDEMLEQGLEQEARELYPYRHLNALQTVGYTELFNYFDGQYDYEEAVRLLKRNSRRYAKRQLTWFRKDKEFTWFHADDLEGIVKFIQEKGVPI